MRANPRPQLYHQDTSSLRLAPGTSLEALSVSQGQQLQKYQKYRSRQQQWKRSDRCG